MVSRACGMASTSLRSQVLATYRQIMRLSWAWRASVVANSAEEGAYIRNEARTLFRKNMDVREEKEIRQCLDEAQARLEMALHYNNPYPRPVNLPPNYVRASSHQKAQTRRTRQSKPVYVRSLDNHDH